MKTIKIEHTRYTNGTPVHRREFLGKYKLLADIFDYYTIVSVDDEVYITTILAGGVPYEDNAGAPTGALYYPSYAFTNFNDSHKVFWTQNAGLTALRSVQEAAVALEAEKAEY